MERAGSNTGEAADTLVRINFCYDTTDKERILIENYLGAKYNIAVAKDVYAGDGNLSGEYDLDVAGIGQFGGNQHTQAFAAGMVVVDNTFLQDDDLLF